MNKAVTYGHARIYTRMPKPDELQRLINDTYNTARRMGLMPTLLRIAVECIDNDGTDYPAIGDYLRTGNPTTEPGGNTAGNTTAEPAGNPAEPAGNTAGNTAER